MAIRKGIPTISGPGMMLHNQQPVISERAKRQGRGRRKLFWMANKFSLHQNLYEALFTQRILNVKCGKLMKSPVAPYPFQIASLMLWQFSRVSTIGRHAVLPRQVNETCECQVHSDLHCSGTENVWKYKFSSSKRLSQDHCWLPSVEGAAQTRWEDLQGMCSVCLLRLPHFLNCRLIVQADQNLTGYKERRVTSELVKLGL